MANPAELTITLPAALAALIRNAVASGAYDSDSEVAQDALVIWQLAQTIPQDEAGLRAKLQQDSARNIFLASPKTNTRQFQLSASATRSLKNFNGFCNMGNCFA